MPKLTDFKPTTTKFVRTEYTPWDNSPPAENVDKIVKNAAIGKTKDPEVKPGSNQVQSGFKSGSNQVQPRFKSGSNQVQSGFKSGLNQVQSGFELGSEPGSNQVQKTIPAKTNTITADDIYGLNGTQRKVLFLIVETCCTKGLLKTPPINNTVLAKDLEIPRETAKTAIRRLVEKNIISKAKSKQGVGGFCCFEITEETKYFVLEVQKNSVNTGLMVAQTRFKSGSEIGSTPPVVSSKYINTTTNVGLDIPENWQNINLEPLEHIGFNLSHLIQIHREYEKNPDVHHLSPELIQNSIDALAYDLKYNKEKLNFKKPPAVVFISMLKKGNPYNSVTPGEYLSPQEEAMRAYNQAESIRKTRELELMQQIKDTELKYWQEKLPEDELLAFCSEQEIEQGIPSKVRIAMRRKKAIELSEHYFNTEIWPNKAKEICAYSLTATAQSENINNVQDPKVAQTEGA